MTKHAFNLTKNEAEIMEVMWKAERPLSRSEIIDLSPDRTWKASSFHILLNSMLQKGAVKVVGFVLNTKKYARTFAPTVTAAEYTVLQAKASPSYTPERIPEIMQVLLPDADEKVLDELEKMIEQARQRRADGEVEEAVQATE